VSGNHHIRPRGKGLDKRTACPSLRELKSLEAVQLLLDPPLVILARRLRPKLWTQLGRAGADPIPFLQQTIFDLAICLQVEGGGDVVADQNRKREIAEAPLFLRDIARSRCS